MKKTIGIIGGMGPLATCDLMEKIIRNTKAERDQEHARIFVDCNTRIPDRTGAILGSGEDPVPEMCSSARKLEQMGAELLVMPCNTAHFFYDRVAEAVRIPVLHMPRETAACLHKAGVSRAAVFATDGTVRSGVYEAALAEQGIEAVLPDDEGQKLLMELIYQYVKAGREDLAALAPEVRSLLKRVRAEGAEYAILGCTELPIAFAKLGMTEGTMDPTTVLARAAVRAAGYACVE